MPKDICKFPSAVKYIILLTCLCFALQTAVHKITGVPWLEIWGCLVLSGDGSGALSAVPWLQVWRLLTYALLHCDFPHLCWNMLGLWLVGAALEADLGSRRLTAIYVVSVICGGISALICGLPGLNGAASSSVLMGASAGTMGILFSFIALNPQSTIYFWLIALIPVKALYLGAAILIWQLGGLFFYSASSTSYSAHIGGIAAGCLAAMAIRQGWKQRLSLWGRKLLKRWQRRHIRVVK